MNRVKIDLMERGTRTRRLAVNSPLKQGVSETVKYYVDFTLWGASSSLPVSSPVIKILDQDDVDKTSVIYSAADVAVVSSVEVEFTLSAMVLKNRYRVFVKGTINSLIGECWCTIDGEL